MNEMTLFNRLFDDFGNDYGLPSLHLRKSVSSPAVDVIEDEKAYTLEMNLPGKTEKDVKIELNHNILTIESESEAASENEEKDADKNPKFLLRERHFEKFSRSFSLPEDVDSDNLSAQVKNGVLSVIMPRKAVAQARRIQISCGA